MQFNPENEIVKLCATGMEAEMQGEMQKAAGIFGQAWENAATDFEKFIAAHYVARHQTDPQQTLHWNKLSLQYALTSAENINTVYPSLYLNVGKSYEDLADAENALRFYQLANDNAHFLAQDPYGDMIRHGIRGALKRMQKS